MAKALRHDNHLLPEIRRREARRWRSVANDILGATVLVLVLLGVATLVAETRHDQRTQTAQVAER